MLWYVMLTALYNNRCYVMTCCFAARCYINCVWGYDNIYYANMLHILSCIFLQQKKHLIKNRNTRYPAFDPTANKYLSGSGWEIMYLCCFCCLCLSRSFLCVCMLLYVFVRLYMQKLKYSFSVFLEAFLFLYVFLCFRLAEVRGLDILYFCFYVCLEAFLFFLLFFSVFA